MPPRSRGVPRGPFAALWIAVVALLVPIATLLASAHVALVPHRLCEATGAVLHGAQDLAVGDSLTLRHVGLRPRGDRAADEVAGPSLPSDRSTRAPADERRGELPALPGDECLVLVFLRCSPERVRPAPVLAHSVQQPAHVGPLWCPCARPSGVRTFRYAPKHSPPTGAA